MGSVPGEAGMKKVRRLATKERGNRSLEAILKGKSVFLFRVFASLRAGFPTEHSEWRTTKRLVGNSIAIVDLIQVQSSADTWDIVRILWAREKSA